MSAGARAMILGILIIGATLAGGVTSLSAQSDETERLTMATTVMNEIMEAPDSAIPRSVLDGAAGITIFPSTIKAGSSSVVIVERAWSLPATPRRGPGSRRRS